MLVRDKKTVRFDALVKKSGQPEQVTLWTKPEDDRDFMGALKARRVVTVLQNNVGTKKDFGLVGFFPKKKAAFLIFPKTIAEAEETKVVGIKYDRFAPSSPNGPMHKPTTHRPAGIQKRKRATRTGRPSSTEKRNRTVSEPKLLRFRATIQIHATQEETIELEARNLIEAEKLIKARSSKMVFDPAKAKITKSAQKAKKVK